MTIEELTALSDDELRVKVAEKMGWKRETRRMYGGVRGVKGWGYNTHLNLGHPERYFTTSPELFPPYSISLDAIHEAWLTLDAHGQDVFAGYLSEIFMGQRDFGNSRINCTTKILGSTARQRAIAFLLV